MAVVKWLVDEAVREALAFGFRGWQVVNVVEKILSEVVRSFTKANAVCVIVPNLSF